MPYVMVPVPEEHVQEAMQAVLRIAARAQITDWDIDSITEFFAAQDEATKAVLSTVARVALARGPVPDAEVASTIELSQREVLGIVRELNELSTQAGHPGIVGLQTISENLPNGRTREQRFLSMSKAIPELVRAAEQAEQESIPHPLADGLG